MQADTYLPIRRSPSHRELPPFRVVAVYEGQAWSTRAQEALIWLEQALGDCLDVHSSCWSFRCLERLDLRAVSIREGAAADVIIVAASESGDLPEQVRRWLETCLCSQRGAHSLLIALHEAGQETPARWSSAAPASVCGYLQPLACRWHTTFLCNEEFNSLLDCGPVLDKIRQRQQLGTKEDDEDSDLNAYSVSDHAGINE